MEYQHFSISNSPSPIEDLFNYVSGFIGDLWLFLAIFIGIPLAIYVIIEIIRVFGLTTTEKKITETTDWYKKGELKSRFEGLKDERK